MSSAFQLRATSRRDRHTSERGRLPLMGWPGRAPTIGDVESDGNQHRSAIDPCQSTPDDSSVLISIPLMLTPPTGSGASLMRSGGQYGQARAPANLAGTIMISWKHAAELTRARYPTRCQHLDLLTHEVLTHGVLTHGVEHDKQP